MIRALRGVIMEALQETAQNGLHGSQHFLIEFLTGHPEVKIPGYLRARFSDRMTIVLQHRFRELQASPEGFSVIVDFDGVPAQLKVPVDAITAFTDPSVKFGLQLQTASESQENGGDSADQTPADQIPSDQSVIDQTAEGEISAGGDVADADEDNVISIDPFRKR